VQRYRHAPAHRRQYGHAALGIGIDVGTLGHRGGDRGARDTAQLRQATKPGGAAVEILVLQLLGCGMTVRRTVELIEGGNVLDMNDRTVGLIGLRAPCLSMRP
jgi:hypothetical protein